MKITFELTPDEIGESVCAFGICALISTRLHQWFDFDQLEHHKLIHNENAGETNVSQLVYNFIDATLDHLELYATCEIELIDGRKVDFQTLDDIQLDQFGCNYDAQCIAKNVKGAKVVVELISTENEVTASVVE